MLSQAILGLHVLGVGAFPVAAQAKRMDIYLSYG